MMVCYLGVYETFFMSFIYTHDAVSHGYKTCFADIKHGHRAQWYTKTKEGWYPFYVNLSMFLSDMCWISVFCDGWLHGVCLTEVV